MEVETLRSHLTAAEAYIEAMQDAIKLLPKESSGDVSGAPFQLREGSKLAKVRDLLHKAGKPLRIGEILSSLGEQATTETRVALAGSLGGYARQGKVFTKTGPNEFGLLEFLSVDEPAVEEEENVAQMPGESQNVAGDDYAQAAEISDDDIPF